jgi:hypothetical protein
MSGNLTLVEIPRSAGVHVVNTLESIFTPRHHVTPEQTAAVRLIAEVFPGTKVELDGIWQSVKPKTVGQDVSEGTADRGLKA